MIRITVEVLPFGSEHNKEEIATIDIANITPTKDQDATNQDYRWIVKKAKKVVFSSDTHEDLIDVITHKRKSGIFPLLYKVFNVLCINRQKIDLNKEG